MKMKLDHVGIVVKDINKTLSFFQEVFGTAEERAFSVARPGYKIKYALTKIEDNYIEFIEPEEGPWVGRLKERGEGSIWELCFEVNNIEEFYDKLVKRNIMPVDRFDKPMTEKYSTSPSGNKFFYLPRDKTYGIWIEILERTWR